MTRAQLYGTFCPKGPDSADCHIVSEMVADDLRATGSPLLGDLASRLVPPETFGDFLLDSDRCPDVLVGQIQAAIDKLHREQLARYRSGN